MKKLFPGKRISKTSLLEFLDKKGFYIILALCVVVVGATAIFVAMHNVNSPGQDFNSDNKMIPDEMNAGSVADVDVKPEEDSPIDTAAALPEGGTVLGGGQKTVAEINTVEKSGDKQAAAVLNQIAVKPAPTPAPTPAPAPASVKTPGSSNTGKSGNSAQIQKFVMPVIGSVTFAFAMDRLAYSKTLEEWRTHSGVDLAADRGTPVKAAADGIVTDIKHDPRFGITIIIDHNNGLKTVYANLASDDMVNPNQKVKQGDIIGCVGNTALFESAEQSHLHFEVLKDNEPVNPETYLPLKE